MDKVPAFSKTSMNRLENDWLKNHGTTRCSGRKTHPTLKTAQPGGVCDGAERFGGGAYLWGGGA